MIEFTNHLNVLPSGDSGPLHLLLAIRTTNQLCVRLIANSAKLLRPSHCHKHMRPSCSLMIWRNIRTSQSVRRTLDCGLSGGSLFGGPGGWEYNWRLITRVYPRVVFCPAEPLPVPGRRPTSQLIPAPTDSMIKSNFARSLARSPPPVRPASRPAARSAGLRD